MFSGISCLLIHVSAICIRREVVIVYHSLFSW